MRKAAGITLISLGAIALGIYGIVMLRLPIPLPLYLLSRVGIFGLHADRVRTPVSAVAFLTVGILLLWHRSKPAEKISSL